MNSNLTIDDLSVKARETLSAGSAVWLYGSRARNEARPDSDWDLLLLVDKEKISKEDFDTMIYPFIEFGWLYGADINPQIYTKEEWNDMRLTPYYQNVERDKKLIYES